MKFRRFSHAFLMLFSALLTLLFALPQASAREVTDPNNVLSSLKSWLAPTDFKAAFTCGSEVEFDAYATNCEVKCSNRWCTSQCFGAADDSVVKKIKLFTENCTEKSVSIYGDNGWSMEVSKEDYIRGGSSILIPMLKNIGHFIQPDGDIRIVSAFPTMGVYKTPPPHNPFAGVTIFAQVDFGAKNNPDIEIVLSRNQRGLMQILVLSAGLKDEFLMAKGITRVIK